MAATEIAIAPGNDKKDEESVPASLDELLSGAIENLGELAENFGDKKGSETVYVMERQMEWFPERNTYPEWVIKELNEWYEQVKQGRVITNSKGKRRYKAGDSYALEETLERLTVDGEVCNEKRSMEMSSKTGPPEKKKQKFNNTENEEKKDDKTEEKDEDKDDQ